MTRRSVCIAAALLAGLTAVAAPAAQSQAPVFRARSTAVTVAVSVKRGNAVVSNLTTADFRLTDNGVPQKVEATEIELVPIDVSLFLDTSGSTSGKLDEMQRDVQAVVTTLRPGDRFRLLTIGDAVEQAVPWVDAGTRVSAKFKPVGGISLVHDALMLGLLHRVDPSRRHLVVGMTDRQDCGSVVPAAVLLEVATRTEAVVHLVGYSGGRRTDVDYRPRTCTPRAAGDGADVIQHAAERTGGELHAGGKSIARDFGAIFSDFRQSYVLRYSPAGADAPGWHAIVVSVPGVQNATIRARQGYFND